MKHVHAAYAMEQRSDIANLYRSDEAAAMKSARKKSAVGALVAVGFIVSGSGVLWPLVFDFGVQSSRIR